MYKGKKERSVNVKGGVGGCRMFELRAIYKSPSGHTQTLDTQTALV